MADEHWTNAAMQLSPLPVLLDYTTLVHSHAWKHWIVSKFDFGSRFQKKKSPKIWSPNQLLKLCAINVSVIAMHWIILKNHHNINHHCPFLVVQDSSIGHLASQWVDTVWTTGFPSDLKSGLGNQTTQTQWGTFDLLSISASSEWTAEPS